MPETTKKKTRKAPFEDVMATRESMEKPLAPVKEAKEAFRKGKVRPAPKTGTH